MFDIAEYYNEYSAINYRDSIGPEIENIDDDISADIDNILNNQFHTLYSKDKFKYHGHGVDIIYPKISFPENRTLIKGPDHIRFLLSLYPQKRRLDNLDKIILRPRHIEVKKVELISLYIRRKKILVYYLHHPHFYKIDDLSIHEYSEFIPFYLPQLFNRELFRDSISSLHTNMIPPLWYILSMISFSPDNKIDKFFIINNKRDKDNISGILDKICLFYSRYGY